MQDWSPWMELFPLTPHWCPWIWGTACWEMRQFASFVACFLRMEPNRVKHHSFTSKQCLLKTVSIQKNLCDTLSLNKQLVRLYIMLEFLVNITVFFSWPNQYKNANANHANMPELYVVCKTDTFLLLSHSAALSAKLPKLHSSQRFDTLSLRTHS